MEIKKKGSVMSKVLRESLSLGGRMSRQRIPRKNGNRLATRQCSTMRRGSVIVSRGGTSNMDPMASNGNLGQQKGQAKKLSNNKDQSSLRIKIKQYTEAARPEIAETETTRKDIQAGTQGNRREQEDKSHGKEA